jgi:hypothetical protein
MNSPALAARTDAKPDAASVLPFPAPEPNQRGERESFGAIVSSAMKVHLARAEPPKPQANVARRSRATSPQPFAAQRTAARPAAATQTRKPTRSAELDEAKPGERTRRSPRAAERPVAEATTPAIAVCPEPVIETRMPVVLEPVPGELNPVAPTISECEEATTPATSECEPLGSVPTAAAETASVDSHLPMTAEPSLSSPQQLASVLAPSETAAANVSAVVEETSAEATLASEPKPDLNLVPVVPEFLQESLEGAPATAIEQNALATAEEELAASAGTSQPVESLPETSEAAAEPAVGSARQLLGTTGAQHTGTMEMAHKTETVAGLKKTLPSESRAHEATDAMAPVSQTLTHSLEGESAVAVTQDNDLPGADRVGTIERVAKMISEQAAIVAKARPDSLSVVLKPDNTTEISLRLTVANGVVQAHARCERGDFDLLNAHWREVQQAMSVKGVALAPLLASPIVTLGNAAEMNFNSSHQPPQHQHKQPEHNGPVYRAAEPQPRWRTPQTKNAPQPSVVLRRLLESWA